MRTMTGWAALLLACTATASAAPVDEHFTVIFSGVEVGHLDVVAKGSTVAVDYDYKNNGRGPTLSETLALDAQGLPERWQIDGSTTFGGKVAERFERRGTTVTWTDSVGPGTAEVPEPRLYIGQNASPWALELYARALLADDDQRLPVLPAGEIALLAGEPITVTGPDGPLDVRAYTLTGLSLEPDYFLMDDKQRLFALISPTFIVIRKGFESEDVRLRDLAATLSLQHLESIQQQTAHDYGAPVRIRNVRLFDPQALALTAPVSVVLNGRYISAVEPNDSPMTPGEVVIDGQGGSLVAGMHEMHAHLDQGDGLLNLAAGVTSVRDMGGNNAVLDTLVQRIESGVLAGPRVTRAGFIEGKSPFNANGGILVDSQETAIDAVRWYAARGYFQVKLYNSMTPAWAPAIATEAHRLGLRVGGHVPAFGNADQMIDAGYDELTHINQIMLGWVLTPEEDTRSLLRFTAMKRFVDLDLAAPRVQATMRRIVERRIAVEPTIGIHEAGMLGRDGEIPPGALDILDHMPIGYQRHARRGWFDLSEPGDDAAYRAAYARVLDTLRMMRERGVLLVPGTDLGGSFAYHRELQLFQQIGYTPAEVLRRATWDMARYLGNDQQLGSIAKGKLADCFLVAGDPTADVAAVKSIRLVVKNGTVYYPSEIYPHFGIRPFVDAPPVVLPDG
jgi:hypothetical protein